MYAYVTWSSSLLNLLAVANSFIPSIWGPQKPATVFIKKVPYVLEDVMN